MAGKWIGLVAIAVMLCSATIWAQTQAASRPYELDDHGLDAAITGLDDSATRYESFKKLTLYFWSYPHSSGGIIMSYGSTELDTRVKRAGQALGEVAKDVALIKQALADANRTMQWWAIGAAGSIINAGGGYSPRADITYPPALELLAKVREFLNSEDAGLRGRAEETLRYIPSEQDRLQKVRQTETDPWNIMGMVSGQREHSESSRLMNGHLMRLLAMNDPKTRADAMFFIDTNASMAEMYHCDFNNAVADKIVDLAGNQIDRPATAGALAALYAQRAGDPERILAKLQEMSTDKDAQVRQRVAAALAGRRDSKELSSIFLSMAKDPDDYVRLCMLMDKGYKGHEDELRQLAQSPNPAVAKQAAEIIGRPQERAAATRQGK